MGAERFETWFVRPANESDYTVTDYGSHVKRVLTSGFFPFFWWARRHVEGERKSCRPPLSISHVPLLTCVDLAD